MRQDPPLFAALNESGAVERRHVIKIEFEVDSIYLTSHAGISGIPGDLIDSVLQPPSSISQRILPDEGRAEISSFTFKVVDKANEFTDEIKERLLDYQGLRGHRIRYYVGYRNPGLTTDGGFGSGTFGSAGYGEGVAGDVPDAIFSDFQLFQTQEITGISFKDGIYSVQCADITRSTRSEIFEPKRTYLRQSLTATSTFIPVVSTSGFTPIRHGASYSDAPNQMAGYLMIEDEVIRYTSIAPDGFYVDTNGRGVFNTKAVAHEIDSGAASTNQPKVDEFIYLEMPGPAMAYALLTGILKYAAGNYGLPSHWHLGIDPDLVRLSDFTGIGEDLWSTADDTLGFIPAFQELKKTDAKKFLETELYQLMGLYSPTYTDGSLGLKRMNPVLIDAPAVVELNETNVRSCTELKHDYKRLYNVIRVDWNWNGDEFTRATEFIDADSVTTHGRAPIKQLKFKGLRGWRHSADVIRSQINIYRDRYSSPPQAINVKAMPSLNRLEVGDIVRLKLANVRDFAGTGMSVAIDRAFEIQRKSDTYGDDGDVDLELLGSTGRASVNSGSGTAEAALPDSYYSSQGTELSTVCTITVSGGVGTVQPGSYSLTGNANLNATGAIYYYNGDLTVANGATITLHNNVQLRIRGFLTINGTLTGVGQGKAGVADTRTLTNPAQQELKIVPLGTPGYVGNSRGMDGVQVSNDNNKLATIPCGMTRGTFASFPLLSLDIVDGVLKGLPNDLRGTSGGPGGPVCRRTFVQYGGTGAASGAGLAIICRGLAFGASGSIDLSGADSATTSQVTTSGIPQVYPGAGGAGGPGCLFVGLDGGDVLIPDLGGKFLAVTGTVQYLGNPIQKREMHKQVDVKRPYAGFLDPALISDRDYSNACLRVQFLPAENTPEEDQVARPAAPTSLVVTSTIGANAIQVTTGSLLPNDVVELYGSSTASRTDAVLIARGNATAISHAIPTNDTHSYWARVRRIVDGPDIFSDWVPENENAGITAAPRPAGTDDIDTDAVTAVYTLSVAGPVDVFRSTTTWVLVASISVPEQAVASSQVVTVNGSVDMHAPSSQFSTFAAITDFVVTGVLSAGDIARNANTASPDARASWMREKTYNVAAGAAKTYRVYGFAGGGAVSGAYANIFNVELKVEVIKR